MYRLQFWNTLTVWTLTYENVGSFQSHRDHRIGTYFYRQYQAGSKQV